MNTCAGCVMKGQCDIAPNFKDETCPCSDCLVKGVCANTCNNWETYYKKMMFDHFTVVYNHKPSEALDGHINNKFQRLRMFRVIGPLGVENACANFK